MSRDSLIAMIGVTILAKNSARHLSQVLEALRSFDEVLVYDTGSTDDTLKIAQRFSNVRVIQGAFQGFGATHNEASSLARYDWILSIDSDEVVTSQLIQEIRQLTLDPGKVYSVSRHNYYNERWIRWCGWHPDRVVRLYNRKATRFADVQVHEAVETMGLEVVSLRAPLNHYPYFCTADFLAKMQSYSDLFAKQYAGKRKSSVIKAVLHAFFAFFKSYILKRGILGGREGFIISVYNANTAFYKYLKLWEKGSRTPTSD